MSIETKQLDFGLRSSVEPEFRAEPFIKWAGGKQALVSQLLPHFPKTYKRYLEPFIGGGAVFFSLRHPVAVISDQNEWLIDTYEAIRDDWKAVATKLERLPNTKEDFLRIRAISPKTLDLVTRAAHFVYLNKTCFRGLFRVNQKGQFNVPYGAYDRRYFDPDNFRAVSKALAGTTILRGDFEGAVIGCEEGDFIYFDPPYYKLGGYADFNRYTAGQFREKDQVRLAALCNELTERGVKWALSNSDTPFIRAIYKQYRLEPVRARREINLNSQDRDVAELLVLNY
ncbi:MAG: Dam family site-specific DNA-(adenine-N6)-methyltransferase [Bdellovibrionaceae bacterium]|nr:Dam family site-specific DNA-(adenine-N6)-methyltransferase [Pseudobdellovibrionaceae bacterium]